MKTVTVSALLALLAYVSAQSATSESLPPSPTESVGCEPHGDHWHCEAAATASDAAEIATATEDAGPSPTESIGCEPHGDHWHCEGPAVTGAATTEDDHDHEDHDHGDYSDEAGTGSLGPSPTESVGCEPHGDHWHCEAAATATDANADEVAAAETSGTESATPAVATDNGAAQPAIALGAAVAAGLLAVL